MENRRYHYHYYHHYTIIIIINLFTIKKNKKQKKASAQQQILSPLKYNTINENFNIDDYDDVAKIDNANDIIDNNDNDNNKRLHSPIRPRWDPHFHVLASFLSSLSLLLSSLSLGYKEL